MQPMRNRVTSLRWPALGFCSRHLLLSHSRLDSPMRRFPSADAAVPKGTLLLLPNGEATRHLQLHQRGELLSPPWRLSGTPG